MSILKNELNNATIEELEDINAALGEQMAKLKKETSIKEAFGNFQTVTKKKGDKELTYYRAVFYEDGKRKDVIATTKQALIDKLWLRIEKHNCNPDTSIEKVYKHYLQSRKAMSDNGIISSQTYRYDVSNWERFFAESDFIKMNIKDVKAIHIRREYERICGDRRYTKKAFAKAVSLLNGIFDEAILLGMIDVNLARTTTTKGCKFKLKEITAGEIEQDVYTEKEIATLRAYLATLPENVYTLGIRLATYFCMRIGELRALTWDDYYPEKNAIFIWHEIIKVSQDGKTRCDKDVPHTKGEKEQGRRWAGVPKEAGNILKKLREINGDKKYILNASRDAKFSISENNFNEHLRKYCYACGITYRSSHKLRFYGISALYLANVEERDIQYIAGHSSITTTRGYDRSKRTGPTLEQLEMALG